MDPKCMPRRRRRQREHASEFDRDAVCRSRDGLIPRSTSYGCTRCVSPLFTCALLSTVPVAAQVSEAEPSNTVAGTTLGNAGGVLTGEIVNRYNAYDQVHGLYIPAKDGDEPQIRECGRCQEPNGSEAAFCMRCGCALKGESAADLEGGVEDDVKRSYAQTHPSDTNTKDKLDALDDPDVKTALLTRRGTSDMRL